MYFNQDPGFNSIRKTIWDVREIIPNIKYDQVRDWFLTNVEQKTRDVNCYNPYVALHAHHQYQVDVGFLNWQATPYSKVYIVYDDARCS